MYALAYFELWDSCIPQRKKAIGLINMHMRLGRICDRARIAPQGSPGAKAHQGKGGEPERQGFMPDYRDLDHVKPRARAHSLQIDNRSRMNVTGVSDVESFHEQEVILHTEAGTLRIEGDGLHLSKLNLDDGQVVVEGEVIALEYEASAPERRGLFTRLFR